VSARNWIRGRSSKIRLEMASSTSDDFSGQSTSDGSSGIAIIFGRKDPKGQSQINGPLGLFTDLLLAGEVEVFNHQRTTSPVSTHRNSRVGTADSYSVGKRW
jgi:hypothetical protein